MSITGRPALPFSKRLRLRGVHSGRHLVRTQDLRGGEERVPFAGNIVPDVFDPNDPLSLRQVLEFCNSLYSHIGPRVGSPTADSQRKDLESRIRRALETGEIVVISETIRRGVQYRVASGAPPGRKGNVWQVHGAGGSFMVVRRTDLLPGEQPVRGPEVRDVIESLLVPEAQLPAAAILTSLQKAGTEAKGLSGPPASAADRRSHLDAGFRSGELVLVALKRHAGGASSSGRARDESVPLSRMDRAQRASTKPHWIEFRVIDVTTGKAVPDVQLEVTLANASKQKRETDGAGLIRFDDTTPGSCTLRSDLKDLRLEDAYSFVEVE